MKCERPGCKSEAPGDALYCSDECFEADWDPIPVSTRVQKRGPGKIQWIDPVKESVQVRRVY